MREAPAKASLHGRFGQEGLEVVGVNLGEDAEAVRRFARRTGIRFPLLLDEEGQSPRRFGLWGHPNTVLIDRAGRIVGLVRGERDWASEAALQAIRRLLDER